MAEETFPRLRIHQRKDRNGDLTVYYYWDGRGSGRPDVALGKDRGLALERWRKCEEGIFPGKGRPLTKALPAKRQGYRRRTLSEHWNSTPEWQRRMYFNAERRAIEAEKSFKLTPDEFFALLVAADGKCQVSGLPLEPGISRSPFAPSLDRKDCAIGYELGNVRIVCHIANVAMNSWGIDPLMTLANALMRKTAD